MRFELKEIKNKDVWENFLLECEEKSFLSSWNWGEFNKMMGNKIWRIGIYSYSTSGVDYLVGVALIIKIEAKRGTFLFLPHGPNIKNPKSEIRPEVEQSSLRGYPVASSALLPGRNPKQIQDYKFQILNRLLEELKKIAGEEGASFVRIAPIWEKNEENNKIFKELDFKKAPIHIHPELTWELNIEKKEEELLAKMRKTTRYLIRQGQKNEEIRIEQGKKIEDVEKFNELYKTTFDRHHFAPFSFDYLKNEFLTFFPENQISIFLGKYKKEIISSGIFIFWQNIGFYHHGASSLKHPKIPVSYLLLWEAIKEAKIRGCKKFNFWGIAPENKKNHPWAGLSLFKMGFGGYKKEYVKTQDFPLSSKYWLTWFFEKLRTFRRFGFGRTLISRFPQR